MGRDHLSRPSACLLAEIRGVRKVLEHIHELPCMKDGKWEVLKDLSTDRGNGAVRLRCLLSEQEWDDAINALSEGLNLLSEEITTSDHSEPDIRFQVTGVDDTDAAPEGVFTELTRKVSILHCSPEELEKMGAGISSQVHAPGRLGIFIDAGWAFGTGTHPSTACAIMAMEYMQQKGWLNGSSRVLDMGTGTGILAIAAALMGAGSVVAVDIDPEALEKTHQNSRVNRVAHRIRVVSSEEWADMVGGKEVTAKFDVCLANLTLSVLKQLLSPMSASVVKGGYLVLSGFKHGALDTVLALLATHGIEQYKIFEKGRWCALLSIRV